ncbi:MAG: CotH kinase family protein [Planctomycetota bacterium]
MKWSLGMSLFLGCVFLAWAQPPEAGQEPKKDPKGGFFKGMAVTRKIVKDFDKDGDGRLNAAERQAAREQLKKDGGLKKGFGKGFPGKESEKGTPGAKVRIEDVKSYPDATLYDPNVLRTLFLEFENPDWEAELADFYRTDVEVPAKLVVDGKTYPNVGVHFRGASSYFAVSVGSKRSLNLSIDFADPMQKLYGSKTLNLLNSHDDPTFMHTVLFSTIARNYLPAPKANFVKVVINGENWGVYTNVQQFNKEFLAENYGNGKGTRWKIKGSPGGGGSLEYLGDKIESYKSLYEMKTNDGDKAWKDLINLCKTLNTTPPDQLEKALEPILDVDEALKFLAVDIALINDDGYWTRGSDYSLFKDSKGKFHVMPHDMNETFVAAKGGMFGKGPPFGVPFPGFGPPPKDEKKDGPPPKDGEKKDFPKGGPGFFGKGPGLELDPLTGLADARKPLRSKLLAVPSLKAKYLEYVKAIARDDLDWKKLGPIVKRNRDLIEPELALDTRKLTSLDAFRKLTADAAETAPGRGTSLRAFADQRRAYLLQYEEGKKKP